MWRKIPFIAAIAIQRPNISCCPVLPKKMVIQWIAHACFKITLESGKCLVFDPFGDIGYQMPPITADVVLISHEHYDHSAAERVLGDFRIFDTEGSFELDGMKIKGISSYHDDVFGAKRGKNIIFQVEAEGLTLTHLGDLGHMPDEALYAQLKGTDVLMIPVGGNYTIDAQQAFEICKRVEPNLILPMHYKTPGLQVDIARLYHFDEAIKGYFDRSVLGKNQFEYTAADKKKRTRVIVMDNSMAEVL